jgi:hypothetical protein
MSATVTISMIFRQNIREFMTTMTSGINICMVVETVCIIVHLEGFIS